MLTRRDLLARIASALPLGFLLTRCARPDPMPVLVAEPVAVDLPAIEYVTEKLLAAPPVVINIINSRTGELITAAYLRRRDRFPRA